MVDINTLLSQRRSTRDRDKLAQIDKKIRQQLKKQDVKGFNTAKITNDGVFIRENSFGQTESVDPRVALNQERIKKTTRSVPLQSKPSEELAFSRPPANATNALTGRPVFVAPASIQAKETPQRLYTPISESEKKIQQAQNNPARIDPVEMDKFQRAELKLTMFANKQKPNVVGGALAFGSGVAISYVQTAKFGKELFTNPITTIKNTGIGLVSAAKNPVQTVRTVVGDVKNPFNVGKIAGDVSQFQIGRIVKGTSNIGQNVVVRTGTKFVPSESVFDEVVLTGKQTFPTSRNIKESLIKFNKKTNGQIIVQTSSPAKIKGNVAGSGRKGAVGLEDTGIYVTPKGKGSPAFLRTTPIDAPSYSFSLNPFKGTFQTPTVTEFTVRGVKRLPKSVLSQRGFEGVRKFQKSSSKSGFAFITKRSEIGQGTIPRQKFVAPKDFTEGNFNVKKGQVRTEAGTSELEAVIPEGTKFKQNKANTFLGKLKGYEEYTKVNGRNIPIRKAQVEFSQSSKTSIFKDNFKLTSKQIRKEQKAFSSVVNNKKYVSPTPSVVLGSSNVSKLRNSSFLSNLKSKTSSKVSNPKGSSQSGSSSSLSSTFSGFSGGSPSKSGFSISTSSFSNVGSSFGGTSSSGSSLSGFINKPPVTPVKPKLPKINQVEGKQSNKKGLGNSKRTFKYTPSVGAVVQDIKGKAIKGKLSGFELRPVTRNF